MHYQCKSRGVGGIRAMGGDLNKTLQKIQMPKSGEEITNQI